MKDIIGGMFPLEKPGNGSGLPLLSDYDSLFLMSVYRMIISFLYRFGRIIYFLSQKTAHL